MGHNNPREKHNNSNNPERAEEEEKKELFSQKPVCLALESII